MIYRLHDKISVKSQEVEMWAGYFSNTRTKKDSNWKWIALLKDWIITMIPLRFLTSEVEKGIESLPNRKAIGVDGIYYEHIKLGREILLNHSSYYLMQLSFPASFKIAIKIPVSKQQNKTARCIDDCRRISLFSLLDRIEQCFVFNKIQNHLRTPIHNIQRVYRKVQEVITAAFISDETIKSCCDDGDRVYSCFVDFSMKGFWPNMDWS